PRNCPISTSLAWVFLEQPNVTTFTRGFCTAAGGFICFVLMLMVRSLNQRFDKLLFIEQLEVYYLFTHTDVFHRDFKLSRDADNHTSFRCTVKFGKRQRVHIGSLGKLLALFNGILSSRGVKH